jgi:hypothetical protein
MKQFLGVLFVAFAVFIFENTVNACDIEFKIISETKPVYHPDDIVVLKVTVVLTHRNCPEGIQATKFDGRGIEILKATKWLETSPGIWERKMQTKITATGNGQAKLSATRTCDKEGGYGEIFLDVG